MEFEITVGVALKVVQVGAVTGFTGSLNGVLIVPCTLPVFEVATPL